MTAVATLERTVLPDEVLAAYPGLDRCPPLFATCRRLDRPSEGPQVARLADKLGYTLMPWQKYVLDTVLELVPDDERPGEMRYAYDYVVLSVPRRGGKTAIVLPRGIQTAISGKRRKGWYTAQSGLDAIKMFTEAKKDIEYSPLNGLVVPRNASGREALTIPRLGSELQFGPPGRKAGHGGALDLVVFDEAWAIDEHVGREVEVGLFPTLATRPNPQVWITSAAGDHRSVWWEKWKSDGRLAVEHDMGRGTAYIHFGAGKDGAYDDPATWRAAHPALGHTIREDYLRGQLTRMTPEDFSRAYLNRPVANLKRAIPEVLWTQQATTEPIPAGPVAFAVEVAPDRSRAVITAASMDDGNEHVYVEVVDAQPGVYWAIGRLQELVERHSNVGIAVDPNGPAGPLADELDVCGIAASVQRVATQQAARAAAAFVTRLEERTLWHRGQPILDAAATAAVKRPLGDGAWLWGRTASMADISALQSATLAAWKAAEDIRRLPGVF